MWQRVRTAACSLLLAMMILNSPQLLDAEAATTVTVTPGINDFTVGTDFPRETIVQLSYPRSTILVGTTGDFLFIFHLAEQAKSIVLFIPPEFTGLKPANTTNIWTNFTDDYRLITVNNATFTPTLGSFSSLFRILNSKSQIAPGWNFITIAASSPQNPYPPSVYAVKIFSLKAPATAGRYFFKIFINGKSIGSSRFPTIVVKGDLNPGFITGTLRYGGPDSSLFGQPLTFPLLPNQTGARIIAEGTTFNGHPARAQTYINSTAQGIYTIYGVAPGSYSLAAYAAGYRTATLPYTLAVHPTQSLEGVDIFLYQGVNVTGTVFSKCENVQIPWSVVSRFKLAPFGLPPLDPGKPRPITVALFNASDGRLVTTTPIVRQTIAVTSPTASSFDFTLQLTDYDGHIPQDFANYTSGIQTGNYFLRAYLNGYIQSEPVLFQASPKTILGHVPIDLWRSGDINVTIHFKDRPGLITSPVGSNRTLVVEAYDEAGNLKAWNITFVRRDFAEVSLTLNGFLDLFFLRDVRDYGLEEGTYLLKAFMTGYYQPFLIKASIALCGPTTNISFDMIRGATLNVTIEPVDYQHPAILKPWAYPGKNLTVYVYDQDGELHGFNVTTQRRGDQNILSNRIKMTLAGWNYSFAVAAQSGSPPTYIPYFLGLHDDWLGTGTYTLLVRTLGYVQTENFLVSAQTSAISDRRLRMLQTGTIAVTLVFEKEDIFTRVDNERANFTRVEVFDDRGALVGANITRVDPQAFRVNMAVAGLDNYAGFAALRWVNFFDTTDGFRHFDYGLPDGTYRVRVLVPGFRQDEDFAVVNIVRSSNVSAVIVMQRLVHLTGFVRWFDFFGDLQDLSWAEIRIIGHEEIVTYSLDGFYEAWLYEGINLVTVSLVGFTPQAFSGKFPKGSEEVLDFYLKAL